MKCLIIFSLCIGTILTAPSLDIYPAGGVGHSHYDQHQQSVDSGRRSVQQRLGSTVTGTSANLVDCGPCLQQQTSAFDAESLDSSLGSHGVGIGLVGLSGGGLSSSLTQSGHSASHFDQQRPIYPLTTSGGASSSLTESAQHISSSQSSPVLIPVSTGGGSESYKSHYEKHISSNAASAPIVVAPISTGGSERYQEHLQRRIESNAAPIIAPITTGGGSERYSHYQKRVESNSAVPVYYPAPSGGSESSYQHNARLVKTSGISPVYAAPIGGGGSEYSSEYAQKLVQNQAAIPVTVYTSPSSSSSSYTHESQKSASSSLSGGHVYPVLTPVGGSSASLLESSNSLSSTGAVLGLPHHTHSLGLGHTHGHLTSGAGSTSSDLNYYMTESERLAKQQAGSIHSGGVRTGSSVVNGGLGTGASHIGVGGTAGSGYRSKSWEKSSKWASGTEYGPDGRPKNYNLLSTAEGEQHNINGKHAGYKAATTTLDDDGKVSTYSIHTP